MQRTRGRAGLESILDDLFLSNIDPAAEQRLPAGLARHLGGAFVVLWTFDPVSGQPCSRLLTDQPEDLQHDYAAHYWRLDPWRAPILQLPRDRPIHGAQVIADATLERTAYYNEFGRGAGTFHMLASVIRLDHDPAAPLAAFAVHRPRQSATFNAGAEWRLAALIPHVRRALQLRDALGAARAALGRDAIAVLLAAMGDAAIVCDRQAKVLHANRAAEAAERVGLISLRARDDPSLTAGAQTARLHSCIVDAAAGGSGGTLRVGRDGFAVVSPLPSGFTDRLGAAPGLVLVVLRALPSAPRAALDQARALFGLTLAEAQAAWALTAGQSPEEIARARDVRLSTIRTLLTRAMVKAEVANLRQLVAILATLPRPPSA